MTETNLSDHASSCPQPNLTPLSTPTMSSAEHVERIQPIVPQVPIEQPEPQNGIVEGSNRPARKPKATTSSVWDHFIKTTINGVEKAQCLHCKAWYSAKSKNGTSHLLDHLDRRCIQKHIKVDVRQQLLNMNRLRNGSSSLINHNFNQVVSRKALANMVILHEYPLAIVDHIAFRKFVESLNPSFNIISRNTLKRDIMKRHSCERQNLKKLFEDCVGKIAITTDMWTASHQRKGYMVVTSHFVDDDWILRNKTLRFAYVPCPHTKETLAQALIDTFNMYNIAEKISCVVVDNCTTNDAMIEILQERLDTRSLLLQGQFLHVRCSAHILNLVVQDGLSVIGPGLERIRSCVLFWTSTPKRIEKFEDKARSLKLDFSRKMEPDCKTRWNSIFMMLVSAFPYKDVFSKLKIQNPRFNFIVPTSDDWEFAEKICEKLEVFYDVTVLFSGRKYPTINLFFTHICDIKISLLSWLSHDEGVIRDMASSMMEKFDKYWSSIKGVLAIGAILDPRNKLACVEFYYEQIYGDMAYIEIKTVKDFLLALLIEYQNTSDDAILSTEKAYGKRKVGDHVPQKAFTRWGEAKKMQKKKVNFSTELDYYLEEDTTPETPNFCVLNFWKNDHKYPTLKKIARDILAIPASTVASESAFSTGGRVLSAHRSSLHVDTVEALMCMQNWMLGEYTVGSFKNAQTFATILEDEDVSDGDVSEVIDANVQTSDVFVEDVEMSSW